MTVSFHDSSSLPQAFVIRWITPAFLIIILVLWTSQKLPGYWQQMQPGARRVAAERGAYASAIGKRFGDQTLSEDALKAKIEGLLGPEGQAIDAGGLPQWLSATQTQAKEKGDEAAVDANTARFVFLGVALMFVFLLILSDIACRNRIGKSIAKAEAAGEAWEARS